MGAPPGSGGQAEVTLVSLGGEATDPLLRRIATDLDGAVDAVESFWGPAWPHEIVIVAAGTDAEFRDQAPGVADTAGVAAVTVADTVNPSSSGLRIVFAPGAVAMSPQALLVVLTHELFHYAARSSTAADAPRWLTEGVADYVARPVNSDFDGVRRGQGVPTALPTDEEFSAREPELTLAYDRAWLFVRYLADRYGPAVLRSFYTRAAGQGHVDVDTALRQVLRTEPADALTGWQEWFVRNGLA
ncbi:hypothetical protein [Mycolicibacterium mengxianglii]|uniref:hypothetical protein n=1 Tax=Mycolicibacterium mengxianglii TaxID=2736649 RepID=UPI0027DA6FB7|nr:hypothetical protein [Mycolicibacterium mengxianglii]